MIKQVCLLFSCMIGMYSCVDHGEVYQEKNTEEYARSFSNRTEIQVNIDSEFAGTLYAIYYQYPYEEEALVKQPALTGKTPIQTVLTVPNDVEKLYIIGNGTMLETGVNDIRITDNKFVRSRGNVQIDAEVLNAINTSYFPEATNNVRGEDLFKCTDLVVSETESTGDFQQAEVWLTFIGDGGSSKGGLYGKLWFYTYPTEKKEGLKRDDCTFYGTIDGEVQPVSYADIETGRNYIFYTKEELSAGTSSYKRYKLGTFDKGLSIGFVYYGNSSVQFTTPYLNEKVENFTLRYLDKSGSFQIQNKYLANGFMRHITAGDFEGNVLGMENRKVTESKYDGDYNDMLCLLESNPLALTPDEPIDPPVIDEFKVSQGIYLFEDNYPQQGDFDFNDVVIEYKIIDYYRTSNGAKQVVTKLLAKGAYFNNEFGFKVGEEYVPFIKNIRGYANVKEGEVYQELNETVSYTLYTKESIQPYLNNGKGYIFDTNYNTGDYPYVMEIPVGDPDGDWNFCWCLENKNIDDCYYFLKDQKGEKRAKDWYKQCKDATGVFVR